MYGHVNTSLYRNLALQGQSDPHRGSLRGVCKVGRWVMDHSEQSYDRAFSAIHPEESQKTCFVPYFFWSPDWRKGTVVTLFCCSRALIWYIYVWADIFMLRGHSDCASTADQLVLQKPSPTKYGFYWISYFPIKSIPGSIFGSASRILLVKLIGTFYNRE